MNYIDIKTGEYPLTEAEIRARNPLVSYPAVFEAEGYSWVFPTPKPKVTILQKAIEAAPVFYPDPVVEEPVVEEEVVIEEEFVVEEEPVEESVEEEVVIPGRYEQAWEVVDAYEDYTDTSGVLVTKEEQEAKAIELATQVEVQAMLSSVENSVQEMLDNKANELSYDSIMTAVTYADDPTVSKFQEEGQALRVWRSLCWGKCYELIARGEMMTETEVMAQMPQYQAIAEI